MKNKIWLSLVFFAVLCFAAPVAAQEPILLCDQDIYDAGHPFFWTQLQKIVPEHLGPGEAGAVYDELFKRYAMTLSVEDKQRPFVQSFMALLGEVRLSLKSANLSMKPGFDGEELSSGSEPVDAVPCQDKDAPYLITIKYLTIAYKKVHDASWETLRGATTRRIMHLDQRYADWFENGLPMWPLETWVNGKLLGASDAEEPKFWQLVVLRPTAGLSVNTSESYDEVKTQAALAIEPLGYVRYIASDYSKYWGASLLLTTGDDAGIGYGILGRYNNYVLGAVMREDYPATGVSSEDVYLFFGYDLYTLLHDKKDHFRGFKGKVRTHLEKFQ